MKNYAKANLGRAFEEQVERSNKMYERRGQAVLIKAHTEVQVKRSGKELTGAKFGEKAPVDFIGLVCGVAVAFDAKSTQEVTKFPLANIAMHQMDFMKRFKEQGGRAFLLVHFAKHFETYLLTIEQIIAFIDANKRKSIPYEYFKSNCKLVQHRELVECDWLNVL